MSLKGGQILHDANGFVLDRIQSAGPGDLNIPEEKIYELGNYESVATVRDIPEISFDMESFDTSTEFEALLINEDPSTFSSTIGSNDIDFKDAIPIDIISPWKSRRGQFDIVKGISIPYLTLENATYRFGVGDNATQSFTLRGDSIFYCPGPPRWKEFSASGVGPYALGETAIEYNQGGDQIYVLSVCLINSTDGAYKRLFYDGTGSSGYLDTSTSFTLAEDPTGSYDTVRVTYATSASYSYTQNGNNPTGNPVHVNTTSVKPAAVKGKDIDVILWSTDATPVATKLTSVQNFEVTWSVTLENDEELGNERYVDTDYDVPEVNGSMAVKPFDAADLWTKLSQITGVPDDEVIGPNITTPVPVEIRVSHPDTGDRLKTFYIEDARFQVPGYQGQVQTKLEQTMNFTSDSGNLLVYNGKRVA